MPCRGVIHVIVIVTWQESHSLSCLYLSAAAFWGFSRGGFPENACIGGAISERNVCEICRRKSPQNTEKHKTKLYAEVPERPLPKNPFFQLLSCVIVSDAFAPRETEAHPQIFHLLNLFCSCSYNLARNNWHNNFYRCIETSQARLFQTWLFAILSRKRSFALFHAVLRSFAGLRFCSVALI